VSTEQTKAVYDHHMAALAGGDVDDVMTDYTEDSLFISNAGGVMKGLDALRGVFEMAAGAMGDLEILAEHVEDDTAFVAWKSGAIPFGTDTFVVRDGKIAVQTVALHFG
jgi:ketosteroid isomerase-like protein